MDRKTAKELLHIQGWLARVAEVVERGRDTYLVDDLLQEAGDSLMMKLGEAANRLSKLGVLAPEGVDWAVYQAAVAGHGRLGERLAHLCDPPVYPLVAHT